MLSFHAGLKITAAVLIAQAVFAQEIIRPGQPRGLAPETLTAINNGYIVTFAPGTPKLHGPWWRCKPARRSGITMTAWTRFPSRRRTATPSTRCEVTQPSNAWRQTG